MTKTVNQKLRARQRLMQNRNNQRNNKFPQKRRVRKTGAPSRMYKNGLGISRRPLPIARNISVRSTVPKFRSDNSDIITVTHREFVDVISTGVTSPFINLKTLRINPGRELLFPWLHRIARNYETYVVEKLMFHYIPTCPTTTTGMIVIAVDYNAEDSPFASLSQAANSKNTITFNPYSEKTHISTHEESNKTMKSKYVSAGDDDQGQDKKMYDVGTFLIYGVNLPADSMLGNLYVEYTIKFKTPSIKSTATTGTQLALTNSNPSASHPLLNSVPGLTWSGDPECLLGTSSTNGTWDTLYFAAGRYLMEAFTYNSATTSSLWTFGTAYLTDHVVLDQATQSSPFKHSTKMAFIAGDDEGTNRLDLYLSTIANLTQFEISFTPITDSMYNGWVSYADHGVFLNPGSAIIASAYRLHVDHIKIEEVEQNVEDPLVKELTDLNLPQDKIDKIKHMVIYGSSS